MKHALQKQIQHELDTRIPRGRRGDKQTEFRSGFYFFRSQRRSFEESVVLATEQIRKQEPGFHPLVRPLAP
jgi:hypothetical protein